MANFHVGQRVRVVRAVDPKLSNTVGQEAVVIGVGGFVAEDDTEQPYMVQMRRTNHRHVCDGSCIEPIIDDGRTVVEWASMPFDPREVTA